MAFPNTHRCAFEFNVFCKTLAGHCPQLVPILTDASYAMYGLPAGARAEQLSYINGRFMRSNVKVDVSEFLRYINEKVLSNTAPLRLSPEDLPKTFEVLQPEADDRMEITSDLVNKAKRNLELRIQGSCQEVPFKKFLRAFVEAIDAWENDDDLRLSLIDGHSLHDICEKLAVPDATNEVICAAAEAVAGLRVTPYRGGDQDGDYFRLGQSKFLLFEPAGKCRKRPEAAASGAEPDQAVRDLAVKLAGEWSDFIHALMKTHDAFAELFSGAVTPVYYMPLEQKLKFLLAAKQLFMSPGVEVVVMDLVRFIDANVLDLSTPRSVPPGLPASFELLRGPDGRCGFFDEFERNLRNLVSQTRELLAEQQDSVLYKTLSNFIGTWFASEFWRFQKIDGHFLSEVCLGISQDTDSIIRMALELARGRITPFWVSAPDPDAAYLFVGRSTCFVLRWPSGPATGSRPA